MEVVACVSSIAGIASLVGQSISGICKLCDFFQDCKSASKTVARFVAELTALKQTIEEVESLISRIGQSLDVAHNSLLTSLKFHLEDCANYVDNWFKVAQRNSIFDESSYKAFFKKILVTTRNKDIKDIFSQITSHRQGISLSLSATGRLLDIENLARSTSLILKVEEASKLTTQALATLGERFCKPELPRRDSSPNLSDIASQLSRIESLVCTHYSQGSNCTPPPDQTSQAGHEGLRPCKVHEIFPSISSPYDSAETFTCASFVGQPPFRWNRNFICICCGTSPSVFDSREQLKVSRKHEEERPFGCHICERRSNSKENIENHMRAFHYGFISWSCGNLGSWQNAYYESFDGRRIDYCGYCGEEYFRSGPGVPTEKDWQRYDAHLRDIHTFSDCDQAKTFLDATYFREHLARFHHGKPGDWNHALVDSCVKYGFVKTVEPRFSAGKLGLPTEEHDYPIVGIRNDLMTRYGSLLLGISGGAMLNHDESLEELRKYIRIGELMAKIRSDQKTLDIMLKRIDRRQHKFAYKDLMRAKETLEGDFVLIANDLEKARQTCWRKGFEMDMTSDLLGIDRYSDLDGGFGMEMAENDKRENLEHFWNEILCHNEIRFWSTKKDRINVWLLQNLAAIPEARTQHRTYLQNGLALEENEWARLVLKFWLIDEAALDINSGTCSTTGAVDSDGRCHSNIETSEARLLRRKTREDDILSIKQLESRKKIKVQTIAEGIDADASLFENDCEML